MNSSDIAFNWFGKNRELNPDGSIPITENEAIYLDAYKERNNLLKQQIGINKEQLAFNRGVGITSGVFQGLGSLTNASLGIWNAYEQSQNNKKVRELTDAQIKNYNEQIEASREARQQRRDELARLSKMRTNTKAQFNTQATVTRSY